MADEKTSASTAARPGTGWGLLRSEIPLSAEIEAKDERGRPVKKRIPVIKELSKAVYGVEGLSDIEEWYLHERLIQSGLEYCHETHVEYLGSELRAEAKWDNGKKVPAEIRYYVFSCTGTLTIDGQTFPACGASDNRKVDAAIKGAVTSAFKNGCKNAGLSLQLWKGGALKLVEDVEAAGVEEQPRGGREALYQVAQDAGKTAEEAKAWVDELIDNQHVPERSVALKLQKVLAKMAQNGQFVEAG